MFLHNVSMEVPSAAGGEAAVLLSLTSPQAPFKATVAFASAEECRSWREATAKAVAERVSAQEGLRTAQGALAHHAIAPGQTAPTATA
jgi:hypothetical protein